MAVYESPTHAFLDLMRSILEIGDTTIRRDQETKELQFQHITIFNPLRRCYLLPGRNDNIFAKVWETLWVLRGMSDIQWLKSYLPRASEFSDDGKTWRGAYGDRIRYFPVHNLVYMDQLEYIVEHLRNDKYSRQAVMSIWHPGIDTRPGKDIPCNNWLHFMIVNQFGEDCLHLSVAQRSADIMWGWSNINLFEWSVLLQAMAIWLGVGVGDIHYTISNLHLYKRHYTRAEDIIRNFPQITMYDCGIRPALISTTWQRFDSELDKLFHKEAIARDDVWKAIDWHQTDDEFFLSASIMAAIWHNWKDMSEEQLGIIIDKMPKTDLRVATIEYLMRYLGIGLIEYCDLDDAEVSALKLVYKWYRDVGLKQS